MKARKTYCIEVAYNDEWRPICEGETRGYALGWLHCTKDAPGPRLACRVVDSTGKVIESTPTKTDVSIGMIAGWPTAEQYERAGNEALERARQIRDRETGRGEETTDDR